MATSLVQVPEDIIFTILRFCFLPEYYALAMTCSVFNKLSQRRAYWIDALQGARLVAPIACTSHQDLSALSYDQLRKIASHTMRLKHNWSLSNPCIDGPVKVVALDPPDLDVIMQVPGTELYVLYSRFSGSVSAWDIGLGKRVSPEIYISRSLGDVSPGLDLPGKFSVALLTASSTEEDDRDNEIVIICLEYGLSRLEGRVKLSITFRHVLHPDLFYWAAILSHEFVGSLRRRIDPGGTTSRTHALEIVAINLKTRRETVIVTDLPLRVLDSASPSTDATMLDGEVFLLMESTYASRVVRCPGGYLPYDDNPEVPAIQTLRIMDTASTREWPKSPGYEISYAYSEGTLSTDDRYDFPAVSVQQITTTTALDSTPSFMPQDTDTGPMDEDEESSSILQIRFWGRPSRLQLDAGMQYLAAKRVVDIPGQLQDSPGDAQLMLLPHSGRQALLIVNSHGSINLVLVQGDCGPDEDPIKIIDVPSYIDLRDVFGLSLDDHRGTITLITMSGHLFAMPFA
ncbi:hypothetical protein D9613_000902 [Agrocybe pediades]|uniref:F-box domain-containing protein n=1 Tax=Agrocybe pediades TaxID=84607 RepID=A0A8H4R2T1_9AGAR|nr:hypothetical protein D9613_000902 [Agrocybe pediades]